MDYRCRLGSLGNSSTALGSSDPEGTVCLSCSWPSGLRFFLPTLFIFRADYATPACVFLLFLLSYFNLAVPMRRCSGEHSFMSSTFSIAVLNGTFFFSLCAGEGE